MNFQTPHTLHQLADLLGATVSGDPNTLLEGVGTLKNATPTQVSFFSNPLYGAQLKTTAAGAVILKAVDLPLCSTCALVTADPYAAYATIAQLCLPPASNVGGIHKTTVVPSSARVAATATLGPGVVLGEGVTIGARVSIGAHCVIADNVTIGEGTVLYPQVIVYHGVRIGRDVILHSGVVLGSDGFGFAMDAGRWRKVPQLGSVVVGDAVEIGANTTVDRGALEDTVIAEGVKIDNQVQIGHNVSIGAHTVIAGCVGIAGSTHIGRYCAIGGASAIGGHLEICDQVQLTGMSMVTHSISRPGIYSSGTGLMDNAAWRKSAVHFRRLQEWTKRIQALEGRVD